ncbi:MAG: SusC/RagA family TonB-linked outer membrane protein, partial [Dysgonamonadaceae bacterium]|nr:SusC/RagA family TonB-linked outer membrane protein [Dysgonamonadaceae bacterium]
MQKLKNRMKHGIMFLLLWMGCIATISAQQKTIKGTITEAKDGEPVIGASVSVKGTSVGTVTDIDGNFTLSVPENGKTLVISYLGLATQEIPIDKTVFSIALKENVSILDEVVVIGYGTVKRRDLTGAVASISAEDIANIPVSSVSEALTGKMAGVQVTTTEGSPDAEVKIRVRGGGSINTSSAPLYIVDGFPVNSISDVATSEIASVEVLKDASSTAIYGARGANGVILITTKSGKDGKITASYDFYGTFKNLAKKLPVLSPYEFAKWQYELANIKGKYNPNGNDNYVKRFGLYDDIDLYRDVDGNDWQNIVFGNTGTTFNHSVNVTGGNDYAKFSASYNRIDDKAIMLNSTFQRDNLNLKATFKPMKELAMDFLTRYSATKVRGSGANEQNEKSSSDARLKHVMIYSPIPLRNLTAMDDEEETQSNLYPPTTSIYDNDQRRSQKRTSIQGGATWEIIKGFKLRSELGIEQRSDITDRFYGLSTYFVGPNGQASV